jgi:hypothetical protein
MDRIEKLPLPLPIRRKWALLIGPRALCLPLCPIPTGQQPWRANSLVLLTGAGPDTGCTGSIGPSDHLQACKPVLPLKVLFFAAIFC